MTDRKEVNSEKPKKTDRPIYECNSEDREDMATPLRIRPDEISDILRRQILESKREIDVYETGTVLQVGDGVARVHGLGNVMASELVE